MPARDYVEAWAVERGQKPLWLREGKAAILEGGAAEERIRGLKKDLASPDAATRRQAAERAGTIHAVDALRLAIGAAGDTDQTVAQAAQASIGRLGWGAALELDEKAWTLVEKEIADAEAIGPVADRVDKMGPLVTEIALAGRQRPDRALPMLQKALTKQMGKPGATAIITALGLLPGEEAQQELEAVLRNGNPFEREEAICAMLASTPDKTLATLENEFSAWEKELSGSFKGVMKTHPSNALTVAKSLLAMAGALGNEKAKVFLKTTLKQTERADLRLAAAAALCAAGDNEGLAFVKGTLRGNGPTQDKAARNIYESLGSHGGVEALQLLKEALWAEGSKMDPQSAGMALGRNGSGEALGILREALQNGNPAIASRAGWGLEFVAGKPGLELATIALTHPDPIVRRTGAYSLGRTNGEKALPLLERALADRDVQVRTTAVYSLKRIGGEPALALIAKALKDPDANVRQAAADGASQVQSNSNF
jgi:HEAT repeat protein